MVQIRYPINQRAIPRVTNNRYRMNPVGGQVGSYQKPNIRFAPKTKKPKPTKKPDDDEQKKILKENDENA